MKKIIKTGSSGKAGMAKAKHFAEHGCEVLGFEPKGSWRNHI